MVNDELEYNIEKQDLTKEPPETEPDRQYYFIKKLRGIVKAKSEELGRPLFAHTECFGCQINAVRVIA